MTGAGPLTADPQIADPAIADPLITSTIKRLCEQHCTNEAVQAAEANHNAPELWQAFNDIGFAYISIAEELGGSGGTLLDALEVLRWLGYYAAPIPAAECSILGGWLLSQAGFDLPDGPVAVPTQPADSVELTADTAPATSEPATSEPATSSTATSEPATSEPATSSTATSEPATSEPATSSTATSPPAAPFAVTLNGTLASVPWASSASQIVFLASNLNYSSSQTSPEHVVCVDMQAAQVDRSVQITQVRNMAGEPRDTVAFNNTKAVAAVAPPGVNQHSLRLRGALSRATLMAGALRKMAQLTVSYTNERIQFGRPVARFQAVQQHLVWAAQDAAMIDLNAQKAGIASHRSCDPAATPATSDVASSDAVNDVAGAEFEIAAVKLIANQAAGRATKACHQAHGAMGMTQEYPLHHLSRRLWSWRMEYGGEAEWAALLGTLTMSQGADGLYPLITSGRIR